MRTLLGRNVSACGQFLYQDLAFWGPASDLCFTRGRPSPWKILVGKTIDELAVWFWVWLTGQQVDRRLWCPR